MTPAEQIDQLIAGLTDWRGKALAYLRKTILAADPAIVEAWKWRGAPVWECHGIIAVAGAFKGKVKLTFAHGAQLADPGHLFNAGLDGNMWRAIDLQEADGIDEAALKALVRAAIAHNQGKSKVKSPRPRGAGRPAKSNAAKGNVTKGG